MARGSKRAPFRDFSILQESFRSDEKSKIIDSKMTIKFKKGQIRALFAFDIGYAISLAKLDQLLNTTPRKPLTHKKPTPSYLQYAEPPRVIPLGETSSLFAVPGQIEATVFDFGAVSISFTWRINETEEIEWSSLPAISSALYHHNLEAEARQIAASLLERIKTAVDRPHIAALVEDYFLFICEEMSPDLSTEEFFREYRATLAQILRFEVTTLSLEQQNEAVGQRFFYYDHDLVVIDWNAAIICDRDYADTVSVLELINVELLEARYLDTRLDRRLSEFQSLVPSRPSLLLPWVNPYRRAIEELAQLRIDSLFLSERVDNALKLIGDLYLARIHAAASKRLYLPDWEAAIARKLEIASDLYQVLVDRVRTSQSHFLEIIVIVLILTEIILSLIE
jgi:hypothetical protein